MDKKTKLTLIFLIGFTLLSFNIKVTVASDDDDDGIDDDFENLNKRDISIEIEANQTQIESSLRSGEKKDEIQLKLTYESEGLSIEISYESDLSSGPSGEFEIEFGITFRKLVEFVDLNSNNIFDPLVDTTIQEKDLDKFLPIEYASIVISEDTDLHYFIVKTMDGNFSAHIYFSEEFYIINNTLITPIQTKIDIEVNSFPYINGNSQLALYTSLESEIDYEVEEVTEDETRGYATNEEGLLTGSNNFNGIFTWNNNASIDGISKEINVSSLNIDDYDGDDQKIYLNYLNGTHIYHDPKVGIAGIYKTDDIIDNPLFLIILLAILSSLSISIGYATYHYRERIFTSHYIELEKKKDLDFTQTTVKYDAKKLESLLDNEKIIQYFKNLPLDNKMSIEDIKVTALSKDFFNIINRFEWEEDDLVDFTREMLSLTPEERKSVFKEMISKSEQLKKNRLDDTKRLYT